MTFCLLADVKKLLKSSSTDFFICIQELLPMLTHVSKIYKLPIESQDVSLCVSNYTYFNLLDDSVCDRGRQFLIVVSGIAH